ncbi:MULTISPECIES: hypothetical protein [unclassified Kitasatospora]
MVLNFNGWGNKQVHRDDALVAERLATRRARGLRLNVPEAVRRRTCRLCFL